MSNTETPFLPSLDASSRASSLVTTALAEAHLQRVRVELTPPGAVQDLESVIDRLVTLLGRLSAELDMLQQESQARRQSRADRVKLDPLSYIGSKRAGASAAMPDRFSLDLGENEFVGYGWYPAERNDGNCWRWSGPGHYGTLLLPSLGGGRLNLSLLLQFPFMHEFRLEMIDVFINETQVDLTITEFRSEGVTRCVAEVHVPEDSGAGRIVVIIRVDRTMNGQQGRQPSELRTLGFALHELTLSKIKDEPAQIAPLKE